VWERRIGREKFGGDCYFSLFLVCRDEAARTKLMIEVLELMDEAWENVCCYVTGSE
jgi:hypothetical protein